MMTATTDSPPDTSQVARLLQNTATLVRLRVSALPDDALVWRTGPGKWCIKEIIGHLTESDKRDFVDRIGTMLSESEPVLKVNDQAEVARLRHDCDKSLQDLLEEFESVRSSSIAFVTRLNVTELDRSGVHPKIGKIRIREVLHDWIYHDLNHLKQIDSIVQSYLWDRLGNIQQFYQS
jgi:hypothetical protein